MIFIEKLIELIPNILLVLVLGYIYLKIYNFISYSKNIKSYEYVFIKSVVCGTILEYTIGFFTNMLYKPWNYILIIFVTVFLAFISAKLINSNLFRQIFKKLGITRTFNRNIWQDLMDKEHSLWADVRSKKLQRHYFGQIVLVEEFERYPRIVLSRYTIYDKHNNIIEDYDKDPTQRIVIETTLYDDIRLVYNENSKNIK